jgi:protein phosphatase
VTASNVTTLEIPDFSLVVLIGATGAGKSTFASRWFKPTEVMSSDYARGLVIDDENDQSVNADAFELVGAIAEKRLKNRRLTVIDATNVRAPERRHWIEIARRWHALPIAIILDPGLDICVARNKARPDRDFGPAVPQRMISEIRKGLRGLQREGFRQIWSLSSVDEIAEARVERRPLWTDRRGEQGPFDIIGDVHGCTDELEALLKKLGYDISWVNEAGERKTRVESPAGRKLIFVGDLVDRGPRSPDALRIAMAAVEANIGFVVQGNHDNKLQRWLEGRKIQINHGLQDSIDQLSRETDAFRAKVKSFLYDLRSHYWLDGGRLAIAHAGLKEEMIGRGSPAVRDFALYGETSGEIDEYGLPVRADWAAAYRGKTAIVYGHTPVPKAEWVNNTVCIDTGCVFGGKLTALRWPEKELVSVPAVRTYFEPVRPPAIAQSERSAQNVADDLLDYSDVAGRRWIDTSLMKRIVVAEENAAAALEVMSRFAIAPQWLIYLPPTMSPVETSKQDNWLERPEEAFAFFRERGQSKVITQEKHMGSRAAIAICRDAKVARTRFGAVTDEAGALWTRTGRPFFDNPAMTQAVLDRVRAALDATSMWEELATDWVLIDAEIMPWSAKASGLIENQYASVAAASQAGLSAALRATDRAAARGIDIGAVRDRLTDRAERARKYASVWAPFTWAVASVDDLRIAPFHILASEGAVHFDKSHRWHMNLVERLAAAGRPLTATVWQEIPVGNMEACANVIDWWEKITAQGGEGMVVKPSMFTTRGSKGLIQPALKVRGREYLRMIYGPEYDAPENLSRLRERSLGGKRALALKEFALGHEALSRFVAREPLRRIHECVFAVLALESEPIDPRL